MSYIDIIFDGPPSHESGRFIEVEDPSGSSVRIGEWIDRANGLWALRIPYYLEFNSTSEQIAKVQSDLFAIREDLRDTLDDAKDARFVRLCAEIGALASEFLPEGVE